MVNNPNNKELKHLFKDVDKVVFKEDGMYLGKSISDKVALIITDKELINQLETYLELDESDFEYAFMSLGHYSIELYKNERLTTTFGFFLGYIRYEFWKGDVALMHKKELSGFLKGLGLKF